MYVTRFLLLCALRVRLEMLANACTPSSKAFPLFLPGIKQNQNVSTNLSEILSYQG
jgi:hypothetical protein